MELLQAETATRGGRRGERRDSPRRSTDVPALATFDGRVVCCTVLDLSSEGARLSPTYLGALPDEFDIRIPSRAKARARVVWRDDVTVGVEFVA